MLDQQTELTDLDLIVWMREVLAEAEAAGFAGEFPIGAILVVVARGRASRRETRSQLMHVEMRALLQGGEPLWECYEHAIPFTTLEPWSRPIIPTSCSPARTRWRVAGRSSRRSRTSAGTSRPTSTATTRNRSKL